TALEPGIVAGDMVLPARVVALGDDAAIIDWHQLAKLGVDTRAVQALLEVLPEDLPVASKGAPVAMADDQAFERPVVEARRRRAEDLRHRRRVPTEMDEDEASPFRDGDVIERIIRLREPRG